jgi:DNA replication protein DnaC
MREVLEDGPSPRRPVEERVKLDALDTSHPKVATAVHVARAWAQRKRDGHTDASLILCGPNGTGKTHIARAIWWSMTARVVAAGNNPREFGEPLPEYPEQPSGLFMLSNDLLGRLGTSYDSDTGIVIPARAASVIGYVPILVIDDVGMEQTIPFIKADDQENERHARFFKAIDHCYGRASVIITSNLSIPELAGQVGRRAWDRLAQMAPRLPNGDSFVVSLDGVPSWRVKEGGR